MGEQNGFLMEVLEDIISLLIIKSFVNSQMIVFQDYHAEQF